MLCGNTRESASSLMAFLERGLAPLSQCECQYQNFHHFALTDISSSLDTTYLEHHQCRENVGLLGSTRIGSRRIIQISAGFMIFFSMLGEPLFYHLAIELLADHVSESLNARNSVPDCSLICCRKIRGAVCLHPVHHLRSRVLRLVRARRLVSHRDSRSPCSGRE